MLGSITLALTSPAFAKDTKQIECLAKNAYHEARGEGTKGMEAVTHVVLNRVKSSKFPDKPCDVIYQRTKKACQFSWVCAPKAIREWALYEKAKEIVRRVYTTETHDFTRGALFFTSGVSSRGRIKIGNHIFW